MAYRTTNTKPKPVPEPDWSVPKENTPGKGMYDRRVRKAAKPSEGGYMDFGHRQEKLCNVI